MPPPPADAGRARGSAGRSRCQAGAHRAAGAVRQVEDDDVLAGLHELRLAGAEPEAVDLAVDRQPIAVPREEERGVGERVAVGPRLGQPLDEGAGVQRGAGRAGGVRHRRGEAAVQRLGLVVPAGVVEAGRGPQLRQHHEVVAALLRDELRGPVDAGARGLVVAVGQLEEGDAHRPILAHPPVCRNRHIRLCARPTGVQRSTHSSVPARAPARAGGQSSWSASSRSRARRAL